MQFTKYWIIVGCSCALRHFAYLHTDHTLCIVSVMKDNGWLMHTEHLHICCAPQGEFWGMPSPFERCRGVGSCSWDATWKLCNFQTQLSPALHHPLDFFSNHIKRSWGEACLQGRAVDGLHWAFGCPETWPPSSRVFWHLWTQSLTWNYKPLCAAFSSGKSLNSLMYY